MEGQKGGREGEPNTVGGGRQVLTLCSTMAELPETITQFEGAGEEACAGC